MKPYQEHDEQNYTEGKINENCGCNSSVQNKSFKENEEWNNSYSFQRHKGNEKDWNGQRERSYYDCNPIRSQSPNLPDESKRFQAIMLNNRLPNCVTESNLPLGESVPIAPRECRQIITDHQTLVGSLESGTDIYFYIFYQTDGDGYVIANRENGRVLEYIDHTSELFRVLTSRLYNGGAYQIFNMNRATTNDFRLQTQTQPSGARYVLRPCNDSMNALLSLVFTPASSGLGNPNTLLSLRESERIPPVPIPSLPSPTRLSPVPDLRNLDDEGPPPLYAPRATIGSALIPCIFVNDVVPLDQRIKQSPYYVLEYRQYWHQLWSYIIPSGGSQEFEEITGIRPEAQGDMRDSLDIEIGADWNLRFGDKSHAFRQQINHGLNTLISRTPDNLGLRIEKNRYFNYHPQQVRFARFAKAYEYRLTRPNGTEVSSPWVALDYNTMLFKSYPNNLEIEMQNSKIINSSNSYDLSVWKTPLMIRDGKIITRK